jgi:hypothetical protein
VKRLSDPAAWPVDLIAAEKGGVITNFPDLPNGLSQSEARDETLAQAEALLDEMILGSEWRVRRPTAPLPAERAAGCGSAGLDCCEVRGLSRNARRRPEQAPTVGAAWLAALASHPPVRRPPRLAPRPNPGGPARARTAPRGDEHGRLSSGKGSRGRVFRNMLGKDYATSNSNPPRRGVIPRRSLTG